ncbi:hypothetical protein [Desulfovibrio sp. TomC]|uniref:hypothetical protein n=1 Tax=Desulfovibrio sp. TomC TaxID=1562888 RepID=UPI0005750927|nr:hypothetical protein [Desulfovibrio sp. TomC]KHK03087.1 hypothetical protein NY78_1616 [Desulfovibrio sp. TomC]
MPRLACFLVLCCLAVPLPARAGVTLVGDTCRQIFDNPRAETIACQTGFRLDAAGRGRLASNSFGLVSDLACSAVISARRSEVIAKVRARGDVALPAQEVRCNLVSGGEPVPVAFHLAPVVRLNPAGQAVDARLGIRDLTGIPEPLATAVAEFLNNDAGLRQNLVAAANEIIPNLPKR